MPNATSGCVSTFATGITPRCAEQGLPQPRRDAGEQQGRRHEREHGVLEHVEAEQVLLAEVVDGRAGDGVDREHAGDVEGDLAAPHAPGVGDQSRSCVMA